MLKNIATWTVSSCLILGAAACGGAAMGGGGATPSGGMEQTGGDPTIGSLTIRNGSNYGIYSLQLSAADDNDQGRDLLAGDPLLPGEGGAVPVFDDENQECVIQDIDLCFNHEDWTIDDSTLAYCATAWAD